jgi:hypothetical protein
MSPSALGPGAGSTEVVWGGSSSPGYSAAEVKGELEIGA